MSSEGKSNLEEKCWLLVSKEIKTANVPSNYSKREMLSRDVLDSKIFSSIALSQS
jgi:hypothetical protein